MATATILRFKQKTKTPQDNPLFQAADAEAVQKAVARCYDLEARLNDETPLAFALREGRMEAALAMMEAGANVNAIRWPVLCSKHAYQNLAMLKALFSLSNDPWRTDPYGGTPLHHAIAWSEGTNLACVKFLLKKGANVNARAVSETDLNANEGRTPIFIAHQNPAMVRLLLQHGADIHVRDDKGNTPLHSFVARFDSTPRMLASIKALLAAGADPNTKNNQEQSPIFDAAPYPALVRLLLKHGADISARNGNQDTPLHHLASSFGGSRRTFDYIEALLLAGADRYAKNKQGKIPMECAMYPYQDAIRSFFDEFDLKQSLAQGASAPKAKRNRL